MVTKVYKFWLRPPHENADLVRKQIRLAHEYRNKLVELARAERGELRALEGTYGNIAAIRATADAAKTACDEAYFAIKAHKQGSRKRSVPDALREAYASAKANKAAAVQALSEAREAYRKDLLDIEEKRKQIADKYHELRKKARATCGVYWGTYLGIEAADAQAREDSPLWWDGQPNDPEFVRWQGEGAVGVQIQAGLKVEDMISSRSRYLRIEEAPLPPNADPKSKKTAKRRYCVLAMRVGSEGRDPIWARWKMVMHRPLPADAVINWAKVKVAKIGAREEWHCLITVKTSENRRHRPIIEAENRLAVDIGWRVREDGLRVAAWRSDSGEHGFLMLNSHMLGGFDQSEAIRSVRDKYLLAGFDKVDDDKMSKLGDERAHQIKTRLLSMLYNDKLGDRLVSVKDRLLSLISGLTLPDWFPKNIYQWRGHARFARLERHWKQNRFDGDDLAYQLLADWRYRDHHLREWECSQRESNLRDRLDFYRKFAAAMARRYSSLVIEDFDTSKIARKPSAEEQEGDNAAARGMRFVASTHELRDCLINAFGGDFVKVPAAYTTQVCSSCGSLEKWDQKTEVEHVCSACGTKWDQDDNACRNLLAYRERPGADETTAPARNRKKPNNSSEVNESKWTKIKRKSQEKRTRVEAARKAASEAAE